MSLIFFIPALGEGDGKKTGPPLECGTLVLRYYCAKASLNPKFHHQNRINPLRFGGIGAMALAALLGTRQVFT